MQFLLAIDGGGSKTVGLLQCLQTGQQWHSRSGPAQLSNDFAGALETVQQLCGQLCQNAQIQPEQVTAVIGLAGAGNPALQQQFKQQLTLPFAAWQLTTDAKTSLYGANMGQPVAMLAIGTGSVGMRLNADNTEQQIGGWGFPIADEGGGAWLGRQLVKKLLWQLDWQKPLSPLLTAVATQCGRDRSTLLPWLKNANATHYASLAPLVYQYDEPFAQQLKIQQANAIAELTACTLGEQDLPLVMLGGLAEQCQPFLPQSIRDLLQPAKGDALAGGLVLAAQLAALS